MPEWSGRFLKSGESYQVARALNKEQRLITRK